MARCNSNSLWDWQRDQVSSIDNLVRQWHQNENGVELCKTSESWSDTTGTDALGGISETLTERTLAPPNKTMTNISRVRNREQIVDVVNLAREIWTEHYESIVGQEQVDYMLGKFQSTGAIEAQLTDGFEYYTVSHKGKIEGYMAIVRDADTSTALLSKIYVRRSARGRGCGREMLEFAEVICRENRIRTLWLTVNKNNSHTLSWYMRMGFKNVGSIVQEIGGGFVMDDYRMEKRL